MGVQYKNNLIKNKSSDGSVYHWNWVQVRVQETDLSKEIETQVCFKKVMSQADLPCLNMQAKYSTKFMNLKFSIITNDCLNLPA